MKYSCKAKCFGVFPDGSLYFKKDAVRMISKAKCFDVEVQTIHRHTRSIPLSQLCAAKKRKTFHQMSVLKAV